MVDTTTPPAEAKVVEGSEGLLLEIGGQVVPNYDATLVPFEEGDVAQATERVDMSLMHRARIAERINRLTRGLERLAHGEYGTCEECGRAIEPARLSARAVGELAHQTVTIFGLDVNLEPFYKVAARQPDMRWVGRDGAGRLLRSPTVFEDVIKLILSTNCPWSATRQMVHALVEMGVVPVARSSRLSPNGKSSLPSIQRRSWGTLLVPSVKATSTSPDMPNPPERGSVAVQHQVLPPSFEKYVPE